MIRFIRKKLCKLISLHDMEFEMNTKTFEVSRCKWCGLRAAVSHEHRRCTLLGVR